MHQQKYDPPVKIAEKSFLDLHDAKVHPQPVLAFFAAISIPHPVIVAPFGIYFSFLVVQ